MSFWTRWQQNPPKVWQLYLAALGLSLAAGVTASLAFGVWRLDPHRDPVRGDFGLVLTVISTPVAFCGAAALLVILRWLCWPHARTRAWHLQAAGAAVLLLVYPLTLAVTTAYLSWGRRDTAGWESIAGDPLPEGLRPPYFPPQHQRFERVDTLAQTTRFWEIGREGATVWQREGFVVEVALPPRVLRRVFRSDEEAAASMDRLIAERRKQGYQRR